MMRRSPGGVKIRDAKEVRELFERRALETTDPDAALMSVYDAGRLDGASAAPEPEARPRPVIRMAFTVATNREMEVIRRCMPYVEAVAEARRVSIDDLMAMDKHRRVSTPRHELIWILREFEKVSYPEAAMATKRTDHAAAVASIKIVERRIRERPELRDELMAIGASVASDRQRAAA